MGSVSAGDDEVNGVADSTDRLSLFVRDLDAEALFEVHDQLDEIERVSLKVVAHVRCLIDVSRIDVKTLNEDLLYFRQNLCSLSHFYPPL